MMLYPAINELNKLTDSRYTLVVLTAKRARDIIDGKPVLTDVEAERPVSLATNEIAEGLITYKRSDEHDEEAPTFENFELDINCELPRQRRKRRAMRFRVTLKQRNQLWMRQVWMRKLLDVIW